MLLQTNDLSNLFHNQRPKNVIALMIASESIVYTKLTSYSIATVIILSSSTMFLDDLPEGKYEKA